MVSNIPTDNDPSLPSYIPSMPLSFSIIGTGALGGYYGARLHHAGHEVHFLLHSDYDHVQRNGLKVESIYGDFSIPAPHIHATLESLPACDVVCVCLKATANAQLKDQLSGKVKPGGCVLVLQNGLGIEEEVAEWVKPAAVLGGLCFLCCNKVGPGHVKHLDYGGIRLGSLAGNPPGSEALSVRVKAAFKSAGIETSIATDLATARWQKLVWNIPFNGLCVVLRCTTHELMHDPAGLQLVQGLMQEVVDASAACGTPVQDGFVQKMLVDTLRMTPYLPSMRLDFDRRQAMEIDAIYTRPILRAAFHGFAMERTRTLRDELCFLQSTLLQSHHNGDPQ